MLERLEDRTVPANVWVSAIPDDTLTLATPNDTAEFIATRDGDLSQALQVSLASSDPQFYAKGYRLFVDGVLVSNGFTFAIDQSSANVQLHRPVSPIMLPGGQMSMSIAPSANYTAGTPSAAALTIQGANSPDAIDDAGLVSPGSTIHLPVLANDDVPAGGAQLHSVTLPSHGTVEPPPRPTFIPR